MGVAVACPSEVFGDIGWGGYADGGARFVTAVGGFDGGNGYQIVAARCFKGEPGGERPDKVLRSGADAVAAISRCYLIFPE
jgi:hypothetical protein